MRLSWPEYLPFKQRVAGSSPARLTKTNVESIRHFTWRCRVHQDFTSFLRFLGILLAYRTTNSEISLKNAAARPAFRVGPHAVSAHFSRQEQSSRRMRIIDVPRVSLKSFSLGVSVLAQPLIRHTISWFDADRPRGAPHSNHSSLVDPVSIGVDRMQRNFELFA